MKDTTVEILKYSDSKAASFVTGLKGWVDRNGRFWGEDEHMARWSGCTHRECDSCGKLIERNSYCITCHEENRVKKYLSLERKKFNWSMGVPLYSDSHAEYFFDDGILTEYLDEHNCTMEQLQLVICSPNYLKPIDEDYFCDDLGEDCELPDEINKALNEFNRVIINHKAVSWFPGKYAADIAGKVE